MLLFNINALGLTNLKVRPPRSQSVSNERKRLLYRGPLRTGGSNRRLYGTAIYVYSPTYLVRSHRYGKACTTTTTEKRVCFCGVTWQRLSVCASLRSSLVSSCSGLYVLLAFLMCACGRVAVAKIRRRLSRCVCPPRARWLILVLMPIHKLSLEVVLHAHTFSNPIPCPPSLSGTPDAGFHSVYPLRSTGTLRCSRASPILPPLFISPPPLIRLLGAPRAPRSYHSQLDRTCPSPA